MPRPGVLSISNEPFNSLTRSRIPGCRRRKPRAPPLVPVVIDRQPATLVFNFGANIFRLMAQADGDSGTARIAVDIGESFLDDGKKSFRCPGNSGRSLFNLQGGLDSAAFRKTTDVPAYSAGLSRHRRKAGDTSGRKPDELPGWRLQRNLEPRGVAPAPPAFFRQNFPRIAEGHFQGSQSFVRQFREARERAGGVQCHGFESMLSTCLRTFSVV